LRVVLDTNVLLSALISDRGAPFAIYRAWDEGRFDLITSTMQIDEIRRVSRYGKLRTIVKPHIVGAAVNNLCAAIVLDRLPPAENEADPFDAFLLAMAEAGGADWLVTGDKRAGLLERGRYGGARIVTPGAFLGFWGLVISKLSP
jgi:uncharacterized protein